MAKSGGGNSHQRAVAAASGMTIPPRKLVEEPSSNPPTTRSKLETFWSSTPVWGVLGLLGGAMISILSLKIVFGLAWAVLCFEFVRIRVFENGVLRRSSNVAFAVVLGAAFIATWPIVPKPKEPASLDQEMNAFSQRFPWLSKAPNDQPLRSQEDGFLEPEQLSVSSGEEGSKGLIVGKVVRMDQHYFNRGHKPVYQVFIRVRPRIVESPASKPSLSAELESNFRTETDHQYASHVSSHKGAQVAVGQEVWDNGYSEVMTLGTC